MQSQSVPHPGPDPACALEEYRQIGENLRFYGNLRFAQLTLFFVATGALLAVLDQAKIRSAFLSFQVLSVGGLLVVAVFAVLEQSAVRYWCHYRDRAVVLEPPLGLEQYSRRPRGSVLNATNAVRLLFVGVALLWIAVGLSAWMAWW